MNLNLIKDKHSVSATPNSPEQLTSKCIAARLDSSIYILREAMFLFVYRYLSPVKFSNSSLLEKAAVLLNTQIPRELAVTIVI